MGQRGGVDAYAWFGLAMSKAQSLEGQLHVVAAALLLAKKEGGPSQSDWAELCEKLGKLTLGTLRCRIQPYAVIPEDLMTLLKEAVEKRNALAHEFFWPRKVSGTEGLDPEEAIQKLQKAASLFSSLFTRLESVIWDLLADTSLDRTEVEEAARSKTTRPPLP
jgi:hypothetical protein